MITQFYDGSNYEGTNTYFIVANSEKQMYSELDDFIKKYGNDDNEIYMYVNRVKPSKINLRPEYSMELEIKDKKQTLLMILYKKVH